MGTKLWVLFSRNSDYGVDFETVDSIYLDEPAAKAALALQKKSVGIFGYFIAGPFGVGEYIDLSWKVDE